MYLTDKDYKEITECGKKRYELIISKDPGEEDRHPFSEEQIAPASIDLRLSDKIWIQRKVFRGKIDTSENGCFDFVAQKYWRERLISKEKPLVIAPGQTVLARTHEVICVPKNCAAKIEAKSSFARLSLMITISDFCNPRYVGHYPLQLHNFGKNKIVLYPYMEICQMMIIKLAGEVDTPYDDERRTSVYAKFDEGGPSRWWASKNNKRMREAFSEERGGIPVDAVVQKVDEHINKQFTGESEDKEFYKTLIYRRLKRFLRRRRLDTADREYRSFLRREEGKHKFVSEVIVKLLLAFFTAFGTVVLNVVTSGIISLFGLEISVHRFLQILRSGDWKTQLVPLLASGAVAASALVLSFIGAYRIYLLLQENSRSYLTGIHE